jgi:hypothetical protein
VLGGCEGKEANILSPCMHSRKTLKTMKGKKKMEISMHSHPSCVSSDLKRHLKVLP